MQILSLICAESVFVDPISNRICILNLLEEFSPQRFPATIPQFCVFIILKKEAEEPDNFVLQVSAKVDREKIFSAPLSLSFQGKQSARAIVQLQGAFLSKPGPLKITVQHEGKSLGMWPIDVNSEDFSFLRIASR